VSETKPRKVVGRYGAIALGIACILLTASLGGTITYYAASINNKDNEVNSQKATTNQSNAPIEDQNNTINQLNTQVNNPQNSTNFILYYDEFGNVSVASPSYNFSPPISMYQALRIALESDGWTASSLNNMTVSASIEYWKFGSNSSSSGSVLLHYVTQRPNDYSPVQVNGTTYRYIWDIVVEPSVGARSIPPPGLYWVDAATAEIVPHGLLA
jgi:hypothetical protein